MYGKEMYTRGCATQPPEVDHNLIPHKVCVDSVLLVICGLLVHIFLVHCWCITGASLVRHNPIPMGPIACLEHLSDDISASQVRHWYYFA